MDYPKWVRTALQLTVGSVSFKVADETFEERRFREYIRSVNTPTILPPDEWVDPYAVTWEGKGHPTGKGGNKEGY